jgi:hypothetical protein
MRLFGTRRTIGVIATFAVAATTILAAGASAATIVIDVVQSKLASSFPDALTGGLMLASFVLIGAGVRARKRSVVIS